MIVLLKLSHLETINRCSDRNTDGTTPNLISVLQKGITIIHEQQSVIKVIGWSYRCEYVVGAFAWGTTLSWLPYTTPPSRSGYELDRIPQHALIWNDSSNTRSTKSDIHSIAEFAVARLDIDSLSSQLKQISNSQHRGYGSVHYSCRNLIAIRGCPIRELRLNNCDAAGRIFDSPPS
jgi:hypothetical protein